jgi:putative oxidoreductase
MMGQQLMQDAGLLVARLMLALVFLVSGIDKALHWSAGLDEVVAGGLPFPQATLAATIAVQILGGLSVALGFRTRLGAFLLAGFTVVATLLYHHFWSVVGEAREHELTTFLEHVAILGGFVAIMAAGPGALSLERRLADHAREGDMR